VETEADGLLSYDRVLKVVPELVRAANDRLRRAALWHLRYVTQ
jgi:hypothetical protein